MNRTAAIIRSEHRSLDAILHGLLYLIGQIRDHAYRPDFALLRAMLYYIDAFPELVHHPKEDRYLFAALRRRAPEFGSVLDDLQAEHRESAALIRRLYVTLSRYEKIGPDGLAAFSASMKQYAEFHWQHMRKEEELVLPVAEQKLTKADWDKIDAGFAENADPVGGEVATGEFKGLFKRIANRAPAPIGWGPPIGK